MASQPKQNEAASPGCLGSALITLFILGFISLLVFFNPIYGLWWEWQRAAERQSAQAAKLTAMLGAAQENAKVFLDAVRNEDGNSAYALLSKDYRDRLSPEESRSKKLDVAVAKGQRLADYLIGEGKVSTEEERATFEGFVQTKDGEKHPFRLVIVNEKGGFWKGGSAWRVELFTVQR